MKNPNTESQEISAGDVGTIEQAPDTRTVYNFHPISGQFTGPSEARRDPLEAEPTYLVPAGATETAPPEAPDGKVPVWIGDEWTLQPDVLGRTFYNVETRQPAVFERFEDYQADLFTDKVPAVNQKWDAKNKNWVADTDALMANLRAERDFRLAKSDWTQLADADLTAGQKAAWVAYRQALRDLPDNADPANVTWPEKPQ